MRLFLGLILINSEPLRTLTPSDHVLCMGQTKISTRDVMLLPLLLRCGIHNATTRVTVPCDSKPCGGGGSDSHMLMLYPGTIFSARGEDGGEACKIVDVKL